LPTSQEDWEKLIAAAPGEDRVPTPGEEAAWNKAVVVPEGGLSALRSALETQRARGQRGPQRGPTKVSLTVRYSPEVVAFFKATGSGWQTRMDEALREYVAEHRTG